MASSLHTSSRPDSQEESHIMALNTPLQDPSFFEPPRASYLEQTSEFSSNFSRGSIALHSAGNASPLLSQHEKQLNEASRSPEHPNARWSTSAPKRPIFTRRIFWLIAFVALLLVAAAVVIPVYFLVIKPQSNSSKSSTGTGTGGGGSGGGSGSGNSPTTGGNGSLVTTSDGTTFTYINNFGGFCESSYFFHIFGFSAVLCLKFVIFFC